jgi:hypothetical protein
MVVQRLLGDLVFAAGGVALDVDGIVGPETIDAITTFQEQHPPLTADGRIDPGGPTFTKLDEVSTNLYGTIAQEQAFPILIAPTPPDAPPDVAALFDDIRQDFSALAPAETVGGASRFPNPVPPYLTQAARVRLAVLGMAEAVPVVLVLILILALLVVLTSNPIWQRAAKDMIKGLRDRMRLLSQKIRDAIQAIIDALEGPIAESECAEVCAPEMHKLKDLQRQTDELLDPKPANDHDPDAMQALQVQLARLHEEFLKAQVDVIDCLKRNGC